MRMHPDLHLVEGGKDEYVIILTDTELDVHIQ